MLKLAVQWCLYPVLCSSADLNHVSVCHLWPEVEVLAFSKEEIKYERRLVLPGLPRLFIVNLLLTVPEELYAQCTIFYIWLNNINPKIQQIQFKSPRGKEVIRNQNTDKRWAHYFSNAKKIKCKPKILRGFTGTMYNVQKFANVF